MQSAALLWIAQGSLDFTDEQKWNMIREKRNKLLRETDWSQLGDTPFTAEEKNSWTIYRQTLRDMPQDYITPDSAMFPEYSGTTPSEETQDAQPIP